MEEESGGDVIGRLGGKDLNRDGRVINLVIVGSSRFYDYSVVEGAIEDWTEMEAHPDLVITGGASGVDCLAERWADNNNIPYAVFNEEWSAPRQGIEDEGRDEAPTSLTHRLLDAATHILAFPSSTSKWTNIVLDMAEERGIPFIAVEVD
ncbi:MAG: SLOG family protein [Candidatus Thalassarchaeaceae archaeon]|nr:SLOG family protein [Candidatus Thalassarchaeaceae archaeon]